MTEPNDHLLAYVERCGGTYATAEHFMDCCRAASEGMIEPGPHRAEGITIYIDQYGTWSTTPFNADK